ncbi:MAG: hypothetical protein RBU37_17510 [Myxococcota bacterium]|jgi:acid stress-induced BolA-like protein IbaG/YrbA|nr:hypothetical protein [Myxococcota bacterium]
MSTKDRVEAILKALPQTINPHVSLTSEGDWHIVATVVSDAFGSRPDEERQELVWGALAAELTDEEMRRVEFVFTLSPEEHRELFGDRPPAPPPS